MTNRVLIAVVSASLSLAACKATVEGENKSWERNTQKITQLSALYPGFAAALKEQQGKAEQAMTAARAVSDKEQSAKKMAEANGLIDGGWVSELGQLEPKQKDLRDKLVKATIEAEHGSDQAAAKVAVDDAQRILKNLDDGVKAGAPTADAAQAVVHKLYGDLQTAQGNVDKVLASAEQRKKQAAMAAKGPDGGTTGGATAGVQPPKPQWKCEYCKHMNEDSRTTCSQCGASRPAPTAPKGAAVAPKKK